MSANINNTLEVTHVSVYIFTPNTGLGKIKGLAEIVLNDQIQIRGLRIIDGENGLFVGYPNDPFYKGDDFRLLTFPITRQLREHIENTVLDRYHSSLKQ